MFPQPKFSYDTNVRLVRNIRNDSSLNSQKRGELLMPRGATGYIRHSALYKQEHIIYQVHFLDQNTIIGCRETELILADEPWIPNEFEYGDKAKLTIALQMNGQKIAHAGNIVSVIAVERDNPDGISYRIQITTNDISVPARALTKL